MKIIKEYSLETITTVVSGVILVIVVYLSQSSKQDAMVISVLTVLSTLLTSVSAAWVFGQSAAKKRISRELEIIRGQLLTVLSNIHHSLNNGEESEELAMFALAQVRLALSPLTSVIHELDEMTNKKMSAEKNSLISFRDTVEEVVFQLNNPSEQVLNGDKDSSNDIVEKLLLIEERLNKEIESINLSQKAVYGEQKPILEQSKFLSRFRKKGMDYVGNTLQYYVLKAIHDELVLNNIYRERTEILDSLLVSELGRLVGSGALSKNKVNGILAILTKADTFDVIKDGDKPKKIRLKTDYLPYSSTKVAHDAVFYAVARECGVGDGIVKNLLGYNNEQPEYCEDRITSVINIMNTPLDTYDK